MTNLQCITSYITLKICNKIILPPFKNNINPAMTSF